jgi:copper homeostasis protein
MSRLLLEIAIASVEDVVTAEAGGADRVEFCNALEAGGVTPSLGLVHEVRLHTRLPLITLVRPRVAGFCYSVSEFRVMQREIDLLLAADVDGIAVGVLTEQGELDLGRMRELARQVGKKQIVCHRAFDVTPDPERALEQLIDLGYCRVLTSGQQPRAIEGAAMVAALEQRAGGRIEILPAGGINPACVVELLQRTGCRQVHGSLRMSRVDPSTAARPLVRFGAVGSEDQYGTTSLEAVKQMRVLLDSLRV